MSFFFFFIVGAVLANNGTTEQHETFVVAYYVSYQCYTLVCKKCAWTTGFNSVVH